MASELFHFTPKIYKLALHLPSEFLPLRVAFRHVSFFPLSFFIRFPSVFWRARCLIMTRFRRKVTPGARTNQPMNSGLTTELLAARVRAWKRVMNRLIPFHSQPGIPHLYFRPSRILRCLPPYAPPPFPPYPFPTARRHAVIENWLPQTTPHFVNRIENGSTKPHIPFQKLLTQCSIFFHL